MNCEHVDSVAQDIIEPKKLNEISLREKVFLGCFLRGLIKDDFSAICPIRDFKGKLFPSDDYLYEGFKELFDNHIIEIHNISNMSYYLYDHKNDWRRIFTKINVASEADLNTTLTGFLYPGKWDDIYTEEAKTLWKEISYHESIELFKSRMEAYGFSYVLGKTTKAFFEDLVNHFSLSHIYYIIWAGAKNAAAYCQEGKVSKKQAANSVLLRMRNAADKIFSGQWSCSDFSRPKECPQSLLSEYFFNSVLKICDQGWTSIPCVITKKDELT